MSTPHRIAVVTGANRGLGFETGRQLVRRGIVVILTARNSAEGEAAAARLRDEGIEVHFHALDVTQGESIARLAGVIERDYGRLDILVNNAGVVLDPMDRTAWAPQSVFEVALDTVRATLKTNTYGPLRVMQALIPLMRGRGNVVNVSSGMGQLAEMEGGWTGYRLSKTALHALTRIFAHELRDTQVKVNAVCPGWVRTDLGGPRRRARSRKAPPASSGRPRCPKTDPAVASFAMVSRSPGRGARTGAGRCGTSRLGVTVPGTAGRRRRPTAMAAGPWTVRRSRPR